MRQGKEAVEVWRRYFERVLNEGGSSEIQGRGGEEEAGGENGLLNEGITRGEVEQTLDNLIKAEGGSRDRWANSARRKHKFP